MSVYRKLARSKKGMSTIFAALFMVILILMGFNLMLWNFIQLDAYNTVISSMNQRDQQAASENLVPTNPGATDFNSPLNAYNITVNNLGGTSVSIARIYITNISPTGTSPTLCAGSNAPCIVEPAPSSTSYSFTLGNIQVGEINHKIQVKGLQINDGSGYKVILASTRGRLFSFFYPWPQTLVNNGQGVFTTNIGPLSIYFDFKSFNFTQGSQTVSQSAFCVPSGTSIVFWVKLANSASDSSVTLKAATIIQMQGYGVNGFGQFITDYIVDSSTINPTSIIAYNEAGSPVVLPPATPNGPASTTIIKFGATSQAGTGAVSISRDNQWIMFIGFSYIYRGQVQGETIPFLDIKSTAGYPATC